MPRQELPMLLYDQFRYETGIGSGRPSREGFGFTAGKFRDKNRDQ